MFPVDRNGLACFSLHRANNGRAMFVKTKHENEDAEGLTRTPNYIGREAHTYKHNVNISIVQFFALCYPVITTGCHGR